MAIEVWEAPDSRGLDIGENSGGTTLRFHVRATAGETEAQVAVAALTGSFPRFNGFIRNSIRVTPNGSPALFVVEIGYGPTGVGGSDQPLGGEDGEGGPPEPTEPPETPTTPLGGDYSISIRPPKLHLLRSRVTISSTGRGALLPPDFKGVVGVDADRKVVGVDWPPEPSVTFKRTVPRAAMSLGYIETLASLAGRTNAAKFYGFDPECVILLEADFNYTQAEGWSGTLGFGVELAESDIEICSGLTVPFKAGFHYLWTYLEDSPDTTAEVLVPVPRAAYVEQMIRPAPFGLLGIGE